MYGWGRSKRWTAVQAIATRATMVRMRAMRMYEDTAGMTRAGRIFGGCLLGDDAASEMIGVSDTMGDVTRGWTIGRGVMIVIDDGATIGMTGVMVFNTIGQTSGDVTMAMGDVSGATMGMIGNEMRAIVRAIGDGVAGAIDDTMGTIGAVT